MLERRGNNDENERTNKQINNNNDKHTNFINTGTIIVALKYDGEI